MSALPQKRPNDRTAPDGTAVWLIDVDRWISVFGWMCMESLATTDTLGRDDAQRETQINVCTRKTTIVGGSHASGTFFKP